MISSNVLNICNERKRQNADGKLGTFHPFQDNIFSLSTVFKLFTLIEVFIFTYKNKKAHGFNRVVL